MAIDKAGESNYTYGDTDSKRWPTDVLTKEYVIFDDVMPYNFTNKEAWWKKTLDHRPFGGEVIYLLMRSISLRI